MLTSFFITCTFKVSDFPPKLSVVVIYKSYIPSSVPLNSFIAQTYKKRAVIEREISCFKFNPCIHSANTVNTVTMRSDLYLINYC